MSDKARPKRPATRTAARATATIPRLPAPLLTRHFAVDVIDDVIKRQQPLDERLEALDRVEQYRALAPSDRGFVRALAMGAVRGLGGLRKVLMGRLERGLPRTAGRLESILHMGLAQLLVLEVPAHAAVDSTVSLLAADPHARHFTALGNAVLRGVAREREAVKASLDPLADNTPRLFADRWIAAYGEEAARRMAAMHAVEAGIDISVKADAAGWAERLGAVLLPTGTLRLAGRGAVQDLPGYAQGAWWVQDAAAALPALLLGARPGERVLDLCAAPGGKTAQLCATGATVTALDRSAQRMQRLSENMARLGFSPDVVVADAMTWEGPLQDAVLVDAPCSATGTARRHPDVLWSRGLDDILRLLPLQAKLLERAAALVKPGGRLVYGVCSLEAEEGERQVEAFLARHTDFHRVPIHLDEVGGQADMVNGAGDLRTLPAHLPAEDVRLAGCDGFFASRLLRRE